MAMESEQHRRTVFQVQSRDDAQPGPGSRARSRRLGQNGGSCAGCDACHDGRSARVQQVIPSYGYENTKLQVDTIEISYVFDF